MILNSAKIQDGSLHDPTKTLQFSYKNPIILYLEYNLYKMGSTKSADFIEDFYIFDESPKISTNKS